MRQTISRGIKTDESASSLCEMRPSCTRVLLLPSGAPLTGRLVVFADEYGNLKRTKKHKMAMLELNRGPALNAGETYPRDSTERTMNIQLGKPVRPCQRSPPSNLDGCSLSPRSRVLPDSCSRLLPSTAPRKRLRKLPRARLLLTPHSPTCLSHSGSMPSGAPSPPPLGPFGVGQIHLEFPGLGERETETLTEWGRKLNSI